MGLYKKVQAYNLMRKGMDTHEANLALVGHPDGRDYKDVLIVLKELLGKQKSIIRLLTNNPYKKLFLTKHGYRVVAESLVSKPTEHNAAYTETKGIKFLHGTQGNEPYAGVTFFRNDLPEAGALKKMLDAMDLGDRGRHVHLGIALLQNKDNARDHAFAEEINTFAKVFADIQEVRIVLHADYPGSRRAYRELQKFLEQLTFPYSLQFRLPLTADLRVDTELIDSLHAAQVIFQLKSAHFALLEQSYFREYFSRPHHSILLDDSFGNGEQEPLEAIRTKMLTLISRGMSRIGVAGGYASENVQKIFELEDYFKIPVSVDAETRLRHEGKLSLPEVERYFWKIIRPITAFDGLNFDQAIQMQKKIHQHAGAATFDLKIADGVILQGFQVFEHVLNPQVVTDARLFSRLLWDRRSEFTGKDVMDIGTGSGILGIVMALGGAKHVLCSDITLDAIANARANIATFGLAGQMQVVKSDLFEAVKGKRADVIVFNHPFFPSAPVPGEKISIAMMDSGDLLQRFLKEAKYHLNPGGCVIMPYHEFAGSLNDPEKYAAQHGYTVRVDRYDMELAFRNDAFKICTLFLK